MYAIQPNTILDVVGCLRTQRLTVNKNTTDQALNICLDGWSGLQKTRSGAFCAQRYLTAAVSATFPKDQKDTVVFGVSAQAIVPHLQ
ncbi:hypothetical protein D3C81_979910 [compost metagenome]